MLNLNASTKFKKDLKTCQKRNYKMPLLWDAVDTLRIPAPLPPKNKDHNLASNYSGYKECHLLPDWLLIYCVDGNDLYLIRTGTHADLFGM